MPPASPNPNLRNSLAFVGNVLFAIVALLALYALIPVSADITGGWVTRLVIGILATAGLIYQQVRTLMRVRRPFVRLARSLVASVLLFVVAFATTYVAMSEASPGSFTQPMDKIGALYFAMTTLATVGYGDIAPVTHTARLVVTLQMAGDLVVLAVSSRLLFRVATMSHSRQEAEAAEAREPGDGFDTTELQARD
jgi:hypothetical protein